MLVLSRKKHEAIVIDGPCRIVVLEAKANGDVRLGIEADDEVKIVREELLQKEAA